MPQYTREQLEERRDEINKRLLKVSKEERIELDNDLEEQAIEMEQHEVYNTMEDNLRKELAMIEDALADMDAK